MNEQERNEILISWLSISVAFAWYFSHGFFNFGDFWHFLPIALIGTATGFIFHELAHKYVAIKFGAHAEYRMWQAGLFLALAMAAIFGIVFAAPGAVYIYSDNLSRKQNGLISLAGPATNIVLGVLFALTYSILNPQGFLGEIIIRTAAINFGLATFNLLPVLPLDGAKVFAWNPIAWGVSIAAAFFLPMLL